VLRRGSSSKKKGAADEPAKETPVAGKAEIGDKANKKAAKKKAAEEKAAQKKAAKQQAAEEKAAQKAGKTKPKKEPKKKRAAEEADAGAPRGILVRRPKTSIYSVLLGISAAALAIGCMMLVLEIWTYRAPWTFPWNIPINFK
jgi:hypothetical protein